MLRQVPILCGIATDILANVAVVNVETLSAAKQFINFTDANSTNACQLFLCFSNNLW